MSVWLNIVLIATTAVLIRGWRRAHGRLGAVRERLEAAARDSERLAPLKASLRTERRRVRRSHRLKRRSQQVVGMVRTLAGCREVSETARRGTRAIVDAFGVRGAALWTLDETPTLLAVAGEGPATQAVGGVAQPAVCGRILFDDDGEPVAHLVVDFGGARGSKVGFDAYVAVLGVVLGASRSRSRSIAGGDGGDRWESSPPAPHRDAA